MASKEELTLLKELNKLEQLPQRQDATVEQLSDLVQFANRLGMYDAADYLRLVVNNFRPR